MYVVFAIKSTDKLADRRSQPACRARKHFQLRNRQTEEKETATTTYANGTNTCPTKYLPQFSNIVYEIFFNKMLDGEFGIKQTGSGMLIVFCECDIEVSF